MHYDHQPRLHPQVKNMSERFNYFQKLPAEIRTMIWEYSLPESRVYEVLDAPNATQKIPAQQGLMFANVHPEPPPALAAVCRESRYFVLHHYKPLTLGKTTKYVDLSRDILLLEPYLLVKRLHRTLNFMSQIPLVRDNINRLALGTSYGIYTGICHPVLNWKVSKSNVGKLLSSLAKFPRLKTLIFIVHQEFQFEFDYRFPHTGNSIGMLTHSQPVAFVPSIPLPPASATGPTPFHPPFINNLRGPAAAPSLSPFLPPPPRAPTHIPQLQPSRPPQHRPLPGDSQPLPPGMAMTGTPIFPNPRPQLVHQAYRFKFDIEANINHTPRRPHLNELLYYPLDYDEDKDDWDLNDADEEESEWCDPWPTNDDWRRFRRRFLRAIRATVEKGLASETDGGCGRANTAFGFGGAYKMAGGGPWGAGRGAERDRDRDMADVKAKIRVPALKGASLLWRYTKGGYV